MSSTKPTSEHTPLYQALHDSRYSRQERIKDIQNETNRKLLCYFSRRYGMINDDDIATIVDLLSKIEEKTNIDLLLQTPGGDIDRAEKIVGMIRERCLHCRVIITESAKSAGTLIAIAADQIVMGYTSELGPIDPQMFIGMRPDGTPIFRAAAAFLEEIERLEEKGIPDVYYPMIQQLDLAMIGECRRAMKRSIDFARKYLSEYSCKGDEEKANRIAETLCDTKKFTSHGAVIDAKQAEKIGLPILFLEPTNNLWKMLWSLHCAYDVELRRANCAKIVESECVSLMY